MIKWFWSLNIALTVVIAAAFIFTAPGIQPAFGENTSVGKGEKPGDTKAMTKGDKTPGDTKALKKGGKTTETKTMGNGADKVKKKTNPNAEKPGADISLKKGGKTTNVTK